MKRHKLKIIEPYYSAVRSGEKTFEIRKNDRGFEVGDTLILSPYCSEKKHYIAHKPTILKKVVYITNYNQKHGIVIMGIREPEVGEA